MTDSASAAAEPTSPVKYAENARVDVDHATAPRSPALAGSLMLSRRARRAVSWSDWYIASRPSASRASARASGEPASMASSRSS